MRFKAGDRIVDPESSRNTEFEMRTGTVVESWREGYPGAIKWDDGVEFSYSEKEFERMKYTTEIAALVPKGDA